MDITHHMLRSYGKVNPRGSKYVHLTIDPPSTLCGYADFAIYDPGPAQYATCPRCFKELSALRDPDLIPSEETIYVTAISRNSQVSTYHYIWGGDAYALCGYAVPETLALSPYEEGKNEATCRKCVSKLELELDPSEAGEHARIERRKQRRRQATRYYKEVHDVDPPERYLGKYGGHRRGKEK